jgi:hypothetical protein
MPVEYGSVRGCRSWVLLTFPLGTTTVWIHICLNESNVTLHNRADVLYPVPGTLLVSFDGTAPESKRDQNQLKLP